MNPFNSGDRVRVFDPRLYIDDVQTPLSVTMQSATVIKAWEEYGTGLIDVVFDYDGKESKAHFVDFVEKIVSNNVACPRCGSTNIAEKMHHAPTFALPECWYDKCEDCEEQFNIN